MIGWLGGSDEILAVGLSDLVSVLRPNTAENVEEALSVLLCALSGDGLPALLSAVIGLNQCGDHVVLLVELCLSCPDSVPSGSNHPHFLTIDQSHWMQDISCLMSLSKIHSCSTACTALTMSH